MAGTWAVDEFHHSGRWSALHIPGDINANATLTAVLVNFPWVLEVRGRERTSEMSNSADLSSDTFFVPPFPGTPGRRWRTSASTSAAPQRRPEHGQEGASLVERRRRRALGV